jgi:hypothetical protein
MKKNKINDGHYLELMDRLHVIMSTLNDHCINHPLAKQEKGIKFTLEYALGQIWDAYQEVGRVQSESSKKVPKRRWEVYQNEPQEKLKSNEKIILRRRKNPKN